VKILNHQLNDIILNLNQRQTLSVGLDIRTMGPHYLGLIRSGSLVEYLGPIHTGSQFLSPNYDMDAYIQHFLEVRLGTCVVSWVEQNARPTSQPKSCESISPKIIKIRLQ
jgi:hypothetical protein